MPPCILPINKLMARIDLFFANRLCVFEIERHVGSFESKFRRVRSNLRADIVAQ